MNIDTVSMTESSEQTGTTATTAAKTATAPSNMTSRAVDTAKTPNAPVAAPGVAKPDDRPSSALSYIEPLGVPIDGSVAPTAEGAVTYQRSDAPPLSSHNPGNSTGSAEDSQDGPEKEDSRRDEESEDSEQEGSVPSRKNVPRAMTEDVTGVGGAFDGLHPPVAHFPEEVEYPSP